MKILFIFALVLGLLVKNSLSSSISTSKSATSTSTHPFPQSVITYMATRQMRYHHYLWHQIRENWNSFSASTQNAFTAINWNPPNPSRTSNGQTITNNYAGEDFLYMHRTMIQTANQIIQQNNDPYGPVQSWKVIPAPGNTTYPVPANYSGGSSSVKTDSYYYSQIQPVETSLKNYANLKKMTLNQLGIKIESGIHNAMHNRWAAASSMGYRSGGSASSGVPNINKKWDSVNYNYLADFYSSHVNPTFWNLHGWIDDRIEDWRKANGLSSITWTGTWTGGPMSSLGSVMAKEMNLRANASSSTSDPDAVGDVLEQALAIFLQSGVQETSTLNKKK